MKEKTCICGTTFFVNEEDGYVKDICEECLVKIQRYARTQPFKISDYEFDEIYSEVF